MKLYMKQKVFSFTDSFTVKDEYGNDRWTVEGEMFSIGHRLHIYDINGNEVAYIQQKVFALLPRFYIFINGIEVAQLVKEFSFFTPRYYLEGTSWTLEGDFFSHDYELNDGNQSIMTLNKEWFTWGDSYMLDISDKVNELMCLSIVLAVDCIIESSRD